MDKGVWVARDANGDLYVYNAKPIRNEEDSVWNPNNNNDFCSEIECFEIHSDCLPNLLWDDDPVFINFDVKDPNAINFF